MSSRGTGEDEAQWSDCSFSASGESLADATDQFQIQELLMQTTPRAEVHSVVSSTLPIEPVTALSAIQPVHTFPNTSEEDYFSESTSAGNNRVAASVRQEGDQPVDTAGLQPGYSVADTFGRRSLPRGLVPTQVITRGAQPAVAGATTADVARVNTALEQRGCAPFHNPNTVRDADTPDDQTVSIPLPCTEGDSLDLMEGEVDFSLCDSRVTEEQDLDPRCHGILTPDSKFMSLAQGETDCIGLQELDCLQNWVDPGISHCNILQSEHEIEARAGDVPVATDASAAGEPEEGGVPGSQQAGVDHCADGRVDVSAIYNPRHATTSSRSSDITTLAPVQGDSGVTSGQKRRSDGSGLAAPPAKRRLGTEAQWLPTLWPQTIDSDTQSVQLETTPRSGALIVPDGNTSSCCDEDILECAPINSAGSVVHTHPLNRDNENEVTSNEGQLFMSVIQEIHYGHERDECSNISAVLQESQNVTEEFQMVTISPQLQRASSDCRQDEMYDEHAASDTDNICAPHYNEDCHLQLDETETEVSEDEHEGEHDDGSHVTASPGKQQTAEEQNSSLELGGPQAHEEESISDHYDADIESNSSSSLDEDARLTVRINELQFMLNSVKRQMEELMEPGPQKRRATKG